MKENRIIFTLDYKVIDICFSTKKDKHFFYYNSDYMKSEYLYICTKCKAIFYTKYNKEHEHTLIKYLYSGNKDYYEENYNKEDIRSLENNEYFYLDCKNYLNIKNKIDEQNLFYSKLIEFKKKEKDININEYISQIKNEIDFINEILKAYLHFHSEISYNNLKLLFNFTLSKLPEKYTDDKNKNYINNIYKDTIIK